MVTGCIQIKDSLGGRSQTGKSAILISHCSSERVIIEKSSREKEEKPPRSNLDPRKESIGRFGSDWTSSHSASGELDTAKKEKRKNKKKNNRARLFVHPYDPF